MSAPPGSGNHVKWIRLLQILVPVVFGLYVISLLYHLGNARAQGQFSTLVLLHPAAMVGIPLAGISALCLVILLRSTSGPIEFKAAGVEFKGAAGPIIMWIMTFLAFVVSIKLLW